MSTAPPHHATRHRRRNERLRETRLLLLQAAALLFARHGYHGVSLDAVAEEAGFSKGAVYSQFSSKQDLLAHLLEHYCEQQHTEIRAILAEPKPLEERIHQLSLRFFHPPNQAADDQPLLFVELWLQAMREPALRSRMQHIQTWARQSVATMIEQEAAAQGAALTVPAEDIAQAVLALGNGLAMQHVLSPSDRTVTAYRWTLRTIFRQATPPPRARGGPAGHSATGSTP
jgi:AcrR family transcriptional regulator